MDEDAHDTFDGFLPIYLLKHLLTVEMISFISSSVFLISLGKHSPLLKISAAMLLFVPSAVMKSYFSNTG